MPSYHNLDDTIKYLLDPFAHEGYLDAERHCELQDACLEEAELSQGYEQWREELEGKLSEMGPANSTSLPDADTTDRKELYES